ncbi:extracellular solute-binding protein [Rhodoferax sp.]|uniref:extracellular solute-binding protein n=1 Tax=Rhodoferax sp. TaxID=50421 RepID=UPI00374D4B52
MQKISFKRAALAALALAAVGIATPGIAATDIKFWTLLSGGDGARLATLVNDFNASQSEYKIVTTTLPWGVPFYTKMRTAAAVGAGPDLVNLHLSRIGDFAPSGVLRAISPAELSAAGISGSDYYERQWKKGSYNGQTYAIPLDTHALVLYYNKALVAKAGLADASGNLKPIEGIAALTDAFKAVKEKTGTDAFSMESNTNSYMGYRLWLSMIAQRDGKILDNGKLVYGDVGVESMKIITDWFSKGYATKNLDYPAANAQFFSGKAAFMLNGVWEVPSMVDLTASKKLPFEYGIVPLPKLYNNQSVWGDSHGFAIPDNKGKPIAADHVKGALKFVDYVGKHSITWAGGGHIPAYVPVAESDAAKQLKPNSDFSSVVAKNVVFSPEGWYGGAAGPLEASAAKYFPAAMTGQLPVDKALGMFDAEARKLIASPRPSK